MLTLENYVGKTETEIKEDIVYQYKISEDKLENIEILVAWESEPDYEMSSYFLIRDKVTGDVFENFGGHCSCYGFEDQWEPTKSSFAYVLSENYGSIKSYGSGSFKTEIQTYIKNLIS